VNYDVGDAPLSVTAGDFNGDTRLDLAVANWLDDNVSVLLGNGDGTLQTAVNYDVGDAPLSVTAGDFNGDTRLDLAVANQDDDNVSVLLGNGDGTFQAAVNYDVGHFPRSMTAGDFNGDTQLDLAVANQDDDNVSVLLGNGDGTFQPAVNYDVGRFPRSVTAGDFNEDTRLDLAVANDGDANVSVLLNNTANVAPVANPDSFTVPEETVLTGNVLTNDTDDTFVPLSAAVTALPEHGGLSLSADGSFEYTPALDFNGTDSFTYTATDALGTSSFAATVTIEVTPVNDAPIAYGTSVTGSRKQGFTGVIASFSDVDTTSVAGAVATLYWDDGTSSTGSIVYNSDTGLFDVIGAHLYRRRGTYSVLIVIVDAEGATATITSTLEIIENEDEDGPRGKGGKGGKGGPKA
jgi:VCBS repeat-containing protein